MPDDLFCDLIPLLVLTVFLAVAALYWRKEIWEFGTFARHKWWWNSTGFRVRLAGLIWRISVFLCVCIPLILQWCCPDLPSSPKSEKSAELTVGISLQQSQNAELQTEDTSRFWLRFKIGAVATFVLLWLSARSYLYERYGRIWANGDLTDSRRGNSPPPFYELPLQRQHELLRNLHREIRYRAENADADPHLIALQGEWGSGKSVIVHFLSRLFNPKRMAWGADRNRFPQCPSKPDGWGRILFEDSAISTSHDQSTDTMALDRFPIFCHVDVTRLDTHEDLHFMCLEALIAHSLVPVQWAFFSYPLSLVFALISRQVKSLFRKAHVGMSDSFNFEFELRPTSRTWQHHLKRTMEHINADRRLVIWCLDEIDRTTPEMAQSTLLLARRELSTKGSVVIVPYVASQLRYKAFNPLLPTRPDILFAMHAVLHSSAMDEDGFADNQTSSSIAERLKINPDELQTSEPVELSLTDGAGQKLSFKISSEGVGQELESKTRSTQSDVATLLEKKLQTYYLTADSGKRGHLDRRFSEKYLSQTPFQVGPMQATEFADAVWHIRSLRDNSADFISVTSGEKNPDNEWLARVAAASKYEIKAMLHAEADRDGPRPVMRQLISTVSELLRESRAALTTHASEELTSIDTAISPELALAIATHAAVVGLAWEIAARNSAG